MRVVDLFAGCGGMSLGFIQAGFEVVAAFDNWPAAVRVYQANFAHPAHCVDLNNTVESAIREYHADMIIGGPPCQDFSSAGKRDETLGRADLTLRFAEIVCAVRPAWFVMENVDRIVKSRVLGDSKSHFQQAGYGLSEIILNASLCGVPQNRKRYFLVGQLNGTDNAIVPFLQACQHVQPMTLRDYFGDKLGIEHYYRHPRSYQRRAIFSIDEPSPTIRGVNRPIPKTYQPHSQDSAPLTPDLRPLTTVERCAIQTFPPDFIWQGSKTEIEQLVGNAVPVKLAEFVAQSIRAYLSSSTELKPQQLRLFA